MFCLPLASYLIINTGKCLPLASMLCSNVAFHMQRGGGGNTAAVPPCNFA
jgi:hypothetical protein